MAQNATLKALGAIEGYSWDKADVRSEPDDSPDDLTSAFFPSNIPPSRKSGSR
jgi:hypothetical protein